MELTEAKKMALDLMKQHNLNDWRFFFDSSRRRFGCCRYFSKEITLSEKLVLINTPERVRLTILHEIAHALCDARTHHGWRWKQKLLEIGGDGQRCYSHENTEVIPPKYKGVCPTCGKEITAHARRRVACSDCCRKFNGGKFDSKHMFNWSTVSDYKNTIRRLIMSKKISTATPALVAANTSAKVPASEPAKKIEKAKPVKVEAKKIETKKPQGGKVSNKVRQANRVEGKLTYRAFMIDQLSKKPMSKSDLFPVFQKYYGCDEDRAFMEVNRYIYVLNRDKLLVSKEIKSETNTHHTHIYSIKKG